ncbi:fibronectin type III domain-containing protein [Marinobacter sp. F4216]|uniref:fibronectin type III domain-containing protein n=1 Tax=Marinobacter sp. F4216 TaxID=2874281 RepID=UPI001CC03F9A|nr:fibronectin type III domain-containing protein [Marinobacter sp. F4216]
MMKRVKKMALVGFAAVTLGAGLAGCNGGTSGSASSGGSDGAYTGGPVAANTAVLSWSAPLTRVNGESIAMGELNKYVIRYGQDEDAMSQQVVVTGAQSEAEMSYVIENLDEGTWYFTIQVEDVNGLMSAPSDTVSKTVNS